MTSLAKQRNFKPLIAPGVRQVDEAALTAGGEVPCPGGGREAEAWIQSIRGDTSCPSGGREAEARAPVMEAVRLKSLVRDSCCDFAISCLVQDMGVWGSTGR